MKPVEYPTTAVLLREVIFEQPDQLGVSNKVKPAEDYADPETGELDDEALAEQMPDEAWGFYVQERLSARVTHDGKEFELTSLPVKRGGTVFVDGEMVDPREVANVARDQRKYMQQCRQMGKPIGRLPHGKSVEPLMIAIQQGDRMIKTLNGHIRNFELERGDRILSRER